MKECNLCKEKIHDEALKCRFCGGFQSTRRSLLDELIYNFKNQSSAEVLLWALILIVSLVVAFKLFGWIAALIIFSIVVGGRFYNMQPTAFITIFSICIAATNLYNQNESLKKQLQQFQLDKRPYLAVDFQYGFGPREKDILFGAGMIFQNSGRFPASDIKTEYLVCDEIGCHDFKTWYRDTYGGFPEVKFVQPCGKINIPVAYIPGISKNAKLACIGIKAIYRGIESSNEYWFMRIDVFRLIRGDNGEVTDLKLIDTHTEWDKNKQGASLDLKVPNWNEYSEKK